MQPFIGTGDDLRWPKQEVQSSLNKLIHNCISVLDFNPDDLIRVKTNDEGEIISVNYDSMKLNQLLYKAVESINESLLLAQKGEVDPITNQVYFVMASSMRYRWVILPKWSDCQIWDPK